MRPRAGRKPFRALSCSGRAPRCVSCNDKCHQGVSNAVVSFFRLPSRVCAAGRELAALA